MPNAGHNFFLFFFLASYKSWREWKKSVAVAYNFVLIFWRMNAIATDELWERDDGCDGRWLTQ